MTDMTEGRAEGHLVRYALPILTGNWLQLLYNAVDSIIAGRFIGRDALASEGIAAPVMNLVILFTGGLCMGTGVLMSEAFGKKDYRRLKDCLCNLLIFGVFSSAVLSASAFALTPLILDFLSCPEEIHSITVIYLRIIFLGTPFTFLYNAFASALKSVGDSKTPLKFLAFSSILNAILDLVLLGIFHCGIAVSAVTTVFSQAFSAVLTSLHMMRKEKILSPGRENLRLDRKILSSILLYASPAALQQAIQPVGKLLIQGVVNSLGTSSIAAFNAVTRVDDFACIPEQGIASSISTYTAQNRGAGKMKRIRDGFRKGIALELGYWVAVCVTVFTMKRLILSLFIKGESAPSVITEGVAYLSVMAFCYVLPSLTNGFQGFYRGMGKMKTTALGTFIQTTIRTICSYILVPSYGIRGIAYSAALGWTVMLLYEIPLYFAFSKRKGLR